MEYVVDTVWDDEALVWIATSKDIPGLVLESGSLDALYERIRMAVPELLSMNKGVRSSDMVGVTTISGIAR
jgi:hypothetical protein